MLAMLNFLNVHNLPIFQPILMILVSKFIVHRALIDKTYLSLGLLSPLSQYMRYPTMYATSKASDQPAHMRSLIRAFAIRLGIL